MESRHRCHFTAVAETGTMARVAEHVFLTQSRLHVAELTAIEIEARVADDVLVLAVPATHPLAAREPVRFAKLADMPPAMQVRRYTKRRLLDAHFQRAVIRRYVVVEIDSVFRAAEGISAIVEKSPAERSAVSYVFETNLITAAAVLASYFHGFMNARCSRWSASIKDSVGIRL